MSKHSFALADDIDTLPLLDEEFDKVEIKEPPADHIFVPHAVLCDDLAWDDQIDNGEEMSL